MVPATSSVWNFYILVHYILRNSIKNINNSSNWHLSLRRLIKNRHVRVYNFNNTVYIKDMGNSYFSIRISRESVKNIDWLIQRTRRLSVHFVFDIYGKYYHLFPGRMIRIIFCNSLFKGQTSLTITYIQYVTI